jgi:Cu(I)/Ag(I) efflux system membrane fusion protein
MKKVLFAVLSFLLLTATFFFGSWHGGRKSAMHESPAGRRVLYYVDPMNPTHTTTKPGPAPCGMPMEPVYAEEGTPQSGNADIPPHPGTVNISSQKQQIIGVQVGEVERKSFTNVIRSSGLVALDEARIYRVSSSASGWVREIYANTPGSMVMKGEPLFAFYSSTFLTAQQAYFYILNTLDSMRQHEFDELERHHFTNVQLRTSTDNLRNLGVSEKQLQELAKSRQYVRNVVVEAPATGFVIARNLTLEQKFEAGAELYRLADLSSVWISADIYKHERPYIRPGQAVRIHSPDLGRDFEATVSHILPQFDAASRTMKVRLDAQNPEFLLRPDMYVDVEFAVEVPPALSVPLDAVLDAGTRKTVFVDRGNGIFEPREVKTGWRFGDRVEVTEGLMEGERIVISGNFLIDSESRMKLAASGYYGDVAKDPVCRMYVDTERAAVAGLKREHGAKAYYFCSEPCKVEFDQQPERFTEKGAVKKPPADEAHAVEGPGAGHHDSVHDQHVPNQGQSLGKEESANGFAKDLVCGMPTWENKAKKEGWSSEFQGKTYYFCSKQCKASFDKNPGRFIAREEARKTSGSMAVHTEPRP